MKYENYKDFCEKENFKEHLGLTNIEFLDKLFHKYEADRYGFAITFYIEGFEFSLKSVLMEKNISQYNQIESLFANPLNIKLLKLLGLNSLNDKGQLFKDISNLTEQQLNELINILEFVLKLKPVFIIPVMQNIYDCRINFAYGSIVFNINFNCIDESIEFYKTLEPVIWKLSLLNSLNKT